MALGYDVYEDDRSFEQKGLTGQVRRYTTTNMNFPCFIICNSDEKPVKAHSINTLKKMFPSLKTYDESVANSLIHIYFNQADKTAKLGVIFPSQVKTFLRLFEYCDVDGYMNSDTKLDGMYRYVLAE